MPVFKFELGFGLYVPEEGLEGGCGCGRGRGGDKPSEGRGSGGGRVAYRCPGEFVVS